jgi:hypothetical protein
LKYKTVETKNLELSLSSNAVIDKFEKEIFCVEIALFKQRNFEFRCKNECQYNVLTAENK